MPRFEARPSRILVALLLIGGALRIWAVLLPGSLWFDELSTGLNVMDRSWGELLEPLGFWQVAPVGFVAAEMAAVRLLGVADFSLRLFPLIVSLASLVLFWRLATRFLSGSTLLGAVGIFAVSPALVWYARKAKQYASDMFVTLVLVLLAVRFVEGRSSQREAWVVGVIGLLAIPFSQPAVFVAAGLLVVLGVDAWRGGSSYRGVATIAPLWGLGCLVQVWTSLRLERRQCGRHVAVRQPVRQPADEDFRIDGHIDRERISGDRLCRGFAAGRGRGCRRGGRGGRGGRRSARARSGSR